jgi:hypothetical protein
MDNREKREAEEKLDSRQKYRKRVETEELQSKLNREKRNNKKKNQKLKFDLEIERLKEHSTGLIVWKRKGTSLIWEGYIKKEICFKINFGVYKYSLSTYVETRDKKDKSPKTSFELAKLQLIAESIAKKLTNTKEKAKDSSK